MKQRFQARSAHMNDIENVVPFILLGLLYVGINPDPWTASLVFQVQFHCRLQIVRFWMILKSTYPVIVLLCRCLLLPGSSILFRILENFVSPVGLSVLL